MSDEQRAVAVLSPVPPVDLVGANRTVLSEGDGPLRLAKVWRNELSGELLDVFERFQDAEEAKVGLTRAHIDALRFTTVPKGLAAVAMTPSQHELLRALLDTYLGRLPDEIAEREMTKLTGRRPRPPPGVGGQHGAGAAALLPHPGASPARGVRQHDA